MKTLVNALKTEMAMLAPALSALKIAFFAFLTFAAALIRIPLPMTPVPLTLQTLVLFIAVYHLNPRELGLSQLLYITVGLVGAPVFAAGVTGMLALVGPTAGYLAGFIVAGVVMAILKSKIKPGYISMAAVFTTGMIIIYALGAAHLVIAYKMNIAQAFIAGVAPFAAADAVKIAAAAAFAKK